MSVSETFEDCVEISDDLISVTCTKLNAGDESQGGGGGDSSPRISISTPQDKNHRTVTPEILVENNGEEGSSIESDALFGEPSEDMISVSNGLPPSSLEEDEKNVPSSLQPQREVRSASLKVRSPRRHKLSHSSEDLDPG